MKIFKKILTFSLQLAKMAITILALQLLLSLIPSFVFADENRAYSHLCEVMDKFHNSFDVYTDQDAGGNHYYPSGWMGDISSISFDSNWTSNPSSGTGCIKIIFEAKGGNWAGVYWQEPENNWGTVLNGGYDISGATKVTFWAKGENGGEKAEFFVGGITGLYPDSLGKISTGYITLTRSWQKYTINLAGRDLSHVIGGFGWVTNGSNNPNGATFYLDDIKYDKSRPDEPRFLVSFETLAFIDPDRYIKNASFIYDNALALLALLARGNGEDLKRAKILADSFICAQNNDRYYTDGRLRNAYMAGDLKDHQSGKARLPGWRDSDKKEWYEDEFQVSSYTGNMAWVIIALSQYYKTQGGEEYKTSAVSLGNWIYDNTFDTRGSGGYTGGYKGWEPVPQKITWKSTEHNIDVYVAFMWLYEITGDEKWKERALHAKNFVEAMWHETEKHFWTGTLDDGFTKEIDPLKIPLDIQAWALMAMNSYNSAVSWAENNCNTEKDGFKGFDFNTDRDGVWFEGTAHMAIAYQINRETDKADIYITELQRAQLYANNTNGKGIVAASHDGLTTGFDWLYYDRLHIGATAWFIFAERRYNPYWGIKTTPYEVEPTSVNFGSVNVGKSSIKTVTVTNTGMANLEIGTIELTGTDASEFSILNDACSGQIVAPSGTCSLNVRFSPTSGTPARFSMVEYFKQAMSLLTPGAYKQTKSAILSIPFNDPDTPTLEVPLSGKGYATMMQRIFGLKEVWQRSLFPSGGK